MFARKLLLLTGDVFFLYLSLILSLFFGFWKAFDLEVFSGHLLPFSLLYFFWVIVFYVFGFYDLSFFKTPSLFYARILGGLAFCFFLGIIFFYLTPFFGISPKTNLLLHVLIFTAFALSWRILFYYFFSAKFQNKLAIIGKNPESEELALIIQRNPHLGYSLVAFLDANPNIIEKIKEKEIDTLVLAEKLEPSSPLAKKLYQYLNLKINFIDLAQAFEMISEKIPVSFISQTWFLENLREGKKSLYDKIKRIIDIILSFILLIITLPFWLLIALIIKLEDRDNILYFQERTGKDGNPFFLIKFRSMVKEAEKKGPVWAKKEDPRTTKFGKILRKTHLDEIPQLINVLRGDISLVGPRPERPEFIEQLEAEIPHYQIRNLIKPGFTGWAQVKFRYGRSIKDSLEKFQYDLYYIKNRSLFLDLRILLKTFELFFKKE